MLRKSERLGKILYFLYIFWYCRTSALSEKNHRAFLRTFFQLKKRPLQDCTLSPYKPYELDFIFSTKNWRNWYLKCLNNFPKASHHILQKQNSNKPRFFWLFSSCFCHHGISTLLQPNVRNSSWQMSVQRMPPMFCIRCEKPLTIILFLDVVLWARASFHLGNTQYFDFLFFLSKNNFVYLNGKGGMH